MKTYILNFGHALRAAVVEQLGGEEIRVPFDLDMTQPTVLEVARAVNRAEAALRERGASMLNGGAAILVVPPRMREGALLLIADLHGRMGVFPRIVLIRRTSDGSYGIPTLSDADREQIQARLDLLMKIETPSWVQRQERALLAARLQSASGIVDLEHVRQVARGRRR